MKWYKTKALIIRDFIIFKNVKWKLFEFIYFPITTIIIWGLFSTFVSGYALEAGLIVLIVNIFWQFAYIAQSSINTQMMEDSWSGSLKNLLASGISETEYALARVMSSLVLSLIIITAMFSISVLLFNTSIIVEKITFMIYITGITLTSSIALSLIVTALIILLGVEYGFLSWTAMQIFVLLSAPFYPVTVFPFFIQMVSWLMPYTYSFESARTLIQIGTIPSGMMINGIIVSIAYLFVSIPFYKWVFKKAKYNGNLIKMS